MCRLLGRTDRWERGNWRQGERWPSGTGGSGQRADRREQRGDVEDGRKDRREDRREDPPHERVGGGAFPGGEGLLPGEPGDHEQPGLRWAVWWAFGAGERDRGHPFREPYPEGGVWGP